MRCDVIYMEAPAVLGPWMEVKVLFLLNLEKDAQLIVFSIVRSHVNLSQLIQQIINNCKKISRG